ncbi:hypothetical protein ANCCAN_01717 [Ancylostoma caninum]|uniref:Uncharacterized protein n=1 Tax=Ancylostoma caninum TaxID=29170 RepID=A0A368H6U2_ANCCA|nr:hypothetical protein ANCCAN_01717 [Ancylostoma caninum]
MKYLLFFLLLNIAVDITALDCPEKGEIPYNSLVVRGTKLCQFHCENVENCEFGVCLREEGKKMRQCKCFYCDGKAKAKLNAKRRRQPKRG